MTITRLQPVISNTGIRRILDNQGREIASISSLLDGKDNDARGKEAEYIHNAICDSFNRIAALEGERTKLIEALVECAGLVTNHENGYMKEFIAAEAKARTLLAELTK